MLIKLCGNFAYDPKINTETIRVLLLLLLYALLLLLLLYTLVIEIR